MELLSVNEAAKGTKQLSAWQLHQLIRSGVIPPGVVITLGRRRFLEKSAWEAFLRNGGGGYHGQPGKAVS